MIFDNEIKRDHSYFSKEKLIKSQISTLKNTLQSLELNEALTFPFFPVTFSMFNISSLH